MLTASNLEAAILKARDLGHNPADPTTRAMGGDRRDSYVCRTCQVVAVLHIRQTRPFTPDIIEEVRVTAHPCTM